MDYNNFKNTLEYCLGAITEQFVIDRFMSYKNGTLETDFPELSDHFHLLR